MAAVGMSRNEEKIRAALRNARDLLVRSRQFGSAGAYVQSFGSDLEAMVRDIDTWAHYIGTPSIRRFARALAGVDGA